MKIRQLFILIVLVGTAFAVHAEAKSNSWISKKTKFVGDYIERLRLKRLDTTYVVLPERRWMASVSSNFAGIDGRVKGSNVPIYGNVNVDMKTGLNGNMTLSASYRGYGINYSFDIAKSYSSDLSIQSNGSTFGGEFRQHTTEGMHGTIDASQVPGELGIKEKDVKVKATLVDAYYVFNPKRFSYAAAMTQSAIQKRSCGSPIAFLTFINAAMTTNNDSIKYRLRNIKKIEIYQVAAGLGYGYNFTPNHGRFLLHGSLIPMVVFFNKNFAKLDQKVNLPAPDGSGFVEHTFEVSSEIKNRHKYFLTGIARLAASYHITDQFLVALTTQLNNINFTSNTGLRIEMNDWLLKGSLRYRF